MNCDSDEDRLSAAEQLTSHNPRAAAEAFAAIACDGTVGDEVRLSAAEQLATADPAAAVAACTAIARDGKVGDEVRLSAAEVLAKHNPARRVRPAWPSPPTAQWATRYACPPPSNSQHSAPAGSRPPALLCVGD